MLLSNISSFRNCLHFESSHPQLESRTLTQGLKKKKPKSNTSFERAALAFSLPGGTTRLF